MAGSDGSIDPGRVGRADDVRADWRHAGIGHGRKGREGLQDREMKSPPHAGGWNRHTGGELR